MKLNEPQRKYRKDIIETLQLIASRNEQLEYQRRVPIANVSAEIFCHWGDGCYCDGKYLQEEWCHPIFSSCELKAMAEFNEILNQIADEVPDLPYIEQFVLTREWAELSEAANTALPALNSEIKTTNS